MTKISHKGWTITAAYIGFVATHEFRSIDDSDVSQLAVPYQAAQMPTQQSYFVRQGSSEIFLREICQVSWVSAAFPREVAWRWPKQECADTGGRPQYRHHRLQDVFHFLFFYCYQLSNDVVPAPLVFPGRPPAASSLQSHVQVIIK